MLLMGTFLFTLEGSQGDNVPAPLGPGDLQKDLAAQRRVPKGADRLGGCWEEQAERWARAFLLFVLRSRNGLS